MLIADTIRENLLEAKSTSVGVTIGTIGRGTLEGVPLHVGTDFVVMPYDAGKTDFIPFATVTYVQFRAELHS